MSDPFEIARNVFMAEYVNIRTPASDLFLAEKIAGFRLEYQNIQGGVDYNHPLWKLAYLYSYSGGHASFLAEILGQFHAAHGPIFRANTTNVACIGGGPGTDAIGIKYYLDTHPTANPIQLACRVYDIDAGWAQLWNSVAQNLGVVGSFQQLNVCMPTSPAVLQQLGTYDLVTISYLVSEVAQYPAAATFFQNLFAAVRADATIVYVDNSNAHTDVFDGYCQTSGWGVVMRNEGNNWAPTKVNVEAKIFAPERSHFLQAARNAGKLQDEGFYPKSSGNLGFRILRKI